MEALRGQNYWLVFHTYSGGHQFESYANEVEAWEHAAQIALDYIDSKHEVFIRALGAFQARNYRRVLELISVPEMDDRCNVEVLEQTIQ